MDKPTRKKLEKHLTTLILLELKKKDKKAAVKTAKKIEEATKSIAKKFAKAQALNDIFKTKLFPKTIPGKTVTKKIIPQLTDQEIPRY